MVMGFSLGGEVGPTTAYPSLRLVVRANWLSPG
jgi:hypothetical protein